jgi:hypothetical protein
MSRTSTNDIALIVPLIDAPVALRVCSTRPQPPQAIEAKNGRYLLD